MAYPQMPNHSPSPLRRGPRPTGCGAPRERHFGFSGQPLRADNDNTRDRSAYLRVLRKWVLPVLALSALAAAAML